MAVRRDRHRVNLLGVKPRAFGAPGTAVPASRTVPASDGRAIDPLLVPSMIRCPRCGRDVPIDRARPERLRPHDAPPSPHRLGKKAPRKRVKPQHCPQVDAEPGE